MDPAPPPPDGFWSVVIALHGLLCGACGAFGSMTLVAMWFTWLQGVGRRARRNKKRIRRSQWLDYTDPIDDE